MRFAPAVHHGLMNTAIDKDLRQALGQIGFPGNVLMGSLHKKDRLAIEGYLSQHQRTYHIFESAEQFDQVVSPDILTKFSKLILNEGMVIRRLKSEMERGRYTLVVMVQETDSAKELASQLYEIGVSSISYFDQLEIHRYQTQL